MSLFLIQKNAVQVNVLLPPIDCVEIYGNDMLQRLKQHMRVEPQKVHSLSQSLYQVLGRSNVAFSDYLGSTVDVKNFYLRVDLVQYALDGHHVYLLGKPKIDQIRTARFLEIFKSLLPENIEIRNCNAVDVALKK